MIDPTKPAPPQSNAIDFPGVERALLLIIGVFALVYLHNQGTSDMAAFWMPYYKQMKGVGLVQGYRETALDYPPLSHALIKYAGMAGEAVGSTPIAGIKSFLLLFGFVSVAVYRNFWGGGIPLLLLAGEALFNASMLGYLDVFYAPTLLLALWALGTRRIALFSVLFGVSCFIKWQPLIIAPFCAWHALRPVGAGPRDGFAWSLPRLGRLVFPAVASVLFILLIYGKQVVEALQAAMNDTFLSGETLNINWFFTYLLQWWHPGKITPLLNRQAHSMDASVLHGWLWVPKIVFMVLFLATLWRFHRGVNTFREFLRASLLGFLTYCMFNPGVHENHFFIPGLLACMLASVDARATVQAVLMMGMAVINLVVFYGFNGAGLGSSRLIGGLDITVPLSLGYFGLYCWWWLGWMRQKPLDPADHVEAAGTGVVPGSQLPGRA